MEIKIDDKAGYCFGVVKAIGAAEEELGRSGRLYCLGDIVHNSAEVERLRRRGLVVIDHEQMEELHDCRVLIRAHGEPPSTYERAAARNITLIDATCPIVLALQKKIKEGYAEMKSVGGQVVIFGKPGHAEVIGLCGQTDNTAIVVSNPDDLGDIDFSRPIRLYSQTTKSREDYRRLIANIESRRVEGSKSGDFVAFDTVCNRVASRARELEQFARSVDLLLFVAGANSSNGHYLYRHCLSVQPNTMLIASPNDVQQEWLEGINSIGISGATSTPRWLMEEVADRVEREK